VSDEEEAKVKMARCLGTEDAWMGLTVLPAVKMRALAQRYQKEGSMESASRLASTGAEQWKAMIWVKAVKMRFLDERLKSSV
jgi:hypothetical protein